MKDKKEKLLNYINLQGKNLLELINQKFFIIFYGCLIFNLFVVFILFFKNFWLLSFIFSFTLMIILKMNELMKVGELKIYCTGHKKMLFLNLILILLNLLNIFLMYSDIYILTLLNIYSDMLKLCLWIISKLK